MRYLLYHKVGPTILPHMTVVGPTCKRVKVCAIQSLMALEQASVIALRFLADGVSVLVRNWLLKFQNLSEFWSKVRKRFWRNESELIFATKKRRGVGASLNLHHTQPVAVVTAQ